MHGFQLLIEWVTCIHYPDNYISREEGKNVITKATLASSSSLLDFFYFKSCSTRSPAWRTCYSDLTHCPDQVRSWILLFLCIFFPTKYQVIPFSHFLVSKLGSDRSVCRKCIIHMHLRVIHYVYGIVYLSWLYAQGYTWFFDHDSHRQHVDYEYCEFL